MTTGARPGSMESAARVRLRTSEIVAPVSRNVGRPIGLPL